MNILDNAISPSEAVSTLANKGIPLSERTLRERASTTRNWPGRVGWAISRRQLLVPRSSAA